MTEVKNVLARKAVLASLSIGRWRPTKVDKGISDEVHRQHNADDDAGRYWKALLPKGALKGVTSVLANARAYHYQRTLPWLDDGARVLPADLFLDYTAKMQELRLAYEKAVDAFCAEYPDHLKAAKVRLNGMFNEADYPPVSEIRSTFTWDVRILPCPDTDDFRIAVGIDNADEIRADVERRMQEVVKSSTREAMERVSEVVGHMAERLRAYKPAVAKDDKTSGAFRDSLVENVRELATLLPSFNFAGDPKFAKIAERIGTELCAHDAEHLRTEDEDRAQVAQAAEAILESVSDFLA